MSRMSDARDLGDDVSAIVRQFPGPVRSSRRRPGVVGRCAMIALLGAALAWISRAAARRGNAPQALFSGALATVFALIEGLNIFAAVTSLDDLRLDLEGFEIQFAWINRRHSWQEVDRFRCAPGRRKKIVLNDNTLSRGFLRRITNFLPEGNSTLPDAYESEEGDFAGLMNEWRERAQRTPR